MKTGLTKKQKNTELYFNAKDPMAEIYTHDTKLKRGCWNTQKNIRSFAS